MCVLICLLDGHGYQRESRSLVPTGAPRRWWLIDREEDSECVFQFVRWMATAISDAAIHECYTATPLASEC